MPLKVKPKELTIAYLGPVICFLVGAEVLEALESSYGALYINHTKVPNEDFLALRTAAEFFTAPAVTKNCCA